MRTEALSRIVGHIGLILITGVSSLVVSLAALKPYAHLQLVPHITEHRQVSWLLTPRIIPELM